MAGKKVVHRRQGAQVLLLLMTVKVAFVGWRLEVGSHAWDGEGRRNGRLAPALLLLFTLLQNREGAHGACEVVNAWQKRRWRE
jgi:hypothetical protein